MRANRDDRVGLGWRPELAAAIFRHLDRIDVVEVIADDWFDSPRPARRALRLLATQVPVVLHGVSLGLAGAGPLERARVEKMARLVDFVAPDFWSEHLAFVRAGGVEIGHLAAPPRTAATVEATARNVEAARRIVGSAPLLENIATLIDPPGSDRDEPAWIADTLAATGAEFLLDLHNLHANATNFGFRPEGLLDAVPADRIRAIHLAGGRWVSSGSGAPPRWLDDHRHDVPDPVYALLEETAARATGPLTVILERDGAFPPMAALVAQLERARVAIRRGRARRGVGVSAPRAERPIVPAADATGMDRVQTFLAHLYVDADLRRRFLANPVAEAKQAGIEPGARDALAAVDRVGLVMAAESFARKRARSAHTGGGGGI